MVRVYFDDINFNSDSEKVAFLKETTNQFNIIDFYNQYDGIKEDEYINGLIVITPKQYIAVSIFHFHQYAIDSIYSLLYNRPYDEEVKAVTSNLVIRLLTGKAYYFVLFETPNAINEYQYNTFMNLIKQLEDHDKKIVFRYDYNYGKLMYFDELLYKSIERFKKIPVTNCATNVIDDNYVVNNKSLLLVNKWFKNKPKNND